MFIEIIAIVLLAIIPIGIILTACRIYTGKMHIENKNMVEKLIDETRLNTNPKAKKQFKRAIKLFISDQPNYYKALTIFESIMDNAVDPLDEAYCAGWVGKCYEMTGEEDNAIELYNQAVKIAPSDTFALSRLAEYHSENDFKKSIKYYKQSLEYDPTEAHTYYRLGKLFSSRGMSDKAIEQYKMAITVNNSYVAPMAEAAIEYAKKGDNKNTLRYFLLAMANDLYEFEKLEEAIKTCL
ncbi:MAG: tetratricopeptide repeat protein [Oscillospiraceae bacterium]|nr:tetratricopeptide repeat protein [Oscillospiraceae bacterium]